MRVNGPDRRRSVRELFQSFPLFVRGLLLSILGVAVLAGALWLWRTWDPQAFMEWRREAGPVPFFTALALLPAIGFPTTPFYMLAGATFSPLANVVGVSLSLAVNVSICYWLAQSGLRRLIEGVLRRGRYRLPTLTPDRALNFALLVKMAPGVPTFIKTYLIAMSGISFPVHFAVCFGVTGCYAAAFVVMGDSLVDRDPVALGLSAVCLAVIVGGLVLIRQRLKPREDAAPSAENKAPGKSRP